MDDLEQKGLGAVKTADRITPFGALLRISSFLIAWWAFTEGSWKEWGVGVVVVIAASLASFHILPLRSWKWSLTGLFAFVPYFLLQSFLGGWDVAVRALRPSMPLNTNLITYRTRLPGNLPRVFLIWVISLLPGTASVQIEDDEVTIHVLNEDESFTPKMKDLEDRIGRIFGIQS